MENSRHAPDCQEIIFYFYHSSTSMMRTLVLFAHPYLEHSYSNRELINFYERHQQYAFRDLYEEYPDFHVAAFRERKRIKNYDRIIFQFPLLWFGIPPLLKLWIDEVFDRVWLNNDAENPFLNKEIIVLVTTGGSAGDYSKEGLYGNTVEEMISGLLVALRFFGAQVKPINVVYNADSLSKKQIIEEKRKFMLMLKHD